MSKSDLSFGIFADAVHIKRLGKVQAFTYLEVKGEGARAVLDEAMGPKSRGDVTANVGGDGFIVTGMSEKAFLLALENIALVAAGQPPQRKTAEPEEQSTPAS